MAFNDLREFIAILEKAGELLRIKEAVDWKYELAGWTRYCYDAKPRGPALLFENIKDYGPGFSVFTNGLGTYPRIALALGLSPETSVQELIEVYRQRLGKPIAPRMVASGPVQENIMTGQEVDLFQFPVPWWHPRDGGRFIGTWCSNISRNAETGVYNLGLYRMQVFDKNHCGVGFLPRTHLGLHYSQRERKNEPLEMAVAIGVDETIIMATTTGVPESVDEYAVAGALREKPVELVKCQTIDLCVPATAEIVLEGVILPHARRPEGPLGEHTGYHAGGVRMRPIYEVSAITFRNQPIFRGQLHGKPADEAHILGSIIKGAGGLAMFDLAGPPGVKAIFCPPCGDTALSAIIQMKPYYVGHSRDVGRFWLSHGAGSQVKYVVIVDEDIDPFDLEQVWWAITTRTRASRDLEVLPFGRISRSDPSAPREGEYTDFLIIDATKKLDYPYNKAYGGHWAPVAVPPEKVMDLVDLKWRKSVKGEPVSSQQITRVTQELEQLEKEWAKFRDQAYALTKEEQETEASRSYPKT